MSVRIAAENFVRRQGRRAAGRMRWALKVADEGIRDTGHGIRHAIEGVRDSLVNLGKAGLRRVRRPVRTALHRKAHIEERWGFYRREIQVDRELATIARDGRPIVLGPWLSEVGFETLYWVPFLHWFQAAYRVPADQMIAVSRGGTESWYRGLAARYFDVWDEMSPEEYARRNAARGDVKHWSPSELDHDILTGVTAKMGVSPDDIVVLHPGVMYRLFQLYWSGQRAMGFIDARLRFARVEPPALIDPGLLPRDYIAMKFYAAQSLPDTPEVRARLQRFVAAASARMPVVLLDTGLVLDEHADYALGGDRVISARPWMTPRNNLGVQTQIIAGARAFVGTCGSLAWLAPRLGVDTSALYINPDWLHAHLPVAMRAYHRLGAGRFLPADLRALDPIDVAPRAGRVTGAPA